MQFGSEDLAKYTFLPAAGDFIRERSVSISDLASSDYERIVARAKQRVLQGVKDAKISPEVKNAEIEVMSFPVSLMLVKSTNQDHIMSRYALAEAVRIEQFLKKERNTKIIEELFKTSLGLELEHNVQSSNLPDFKIPIEEYIKRATQFHKNEWKLVNRVVGAGKVFLVQDDLIRLIREEIRTMIINRLKDIKVPKLPENLEQIVKEIIKIAPPPPLSPYTIINIAPENYPPCVRRAIDMLEKGENVPHYGRFLMTTYLLAVGKNVDDIVKMFPKAPDFKQNVTRYQVEHLAGLKGGRKRYRVPSCKTLQTHQFCFMDPVKCYQISTPLQYPSRKSPQLVKASDEKRTGTKGTAGQKERKRREWMKTQR